MRLLEFYNVFPDEQTCKLELIKNRLEESVICKKCGSRQHYWKSKESNGKNASLGTYINK